MALTNLGPCTPSKPSEGPCGGAPRWVDCHLKSVCGGYPSSGPSVVECVSRALIAAMEEGHLEGVIAPEAWKQNPDIFDSSQVPGITIQNYLKRLQACFRCSDAALVGALISMDRFLERCESAGKEPRRVTKWNVHRLFFACLVVTVKYNEDLIYGNNHYAKSGGIHVREVNRMERFLLMGLDYHLRVQPEQYDFYESVLLRMGSTTEAVALNAGPSPTATAAAAAALLTCAAAAGETAESVQGHTRPKIDAVTGGPSLILQQ